MIVTAYLMVQKEVKTIKGFLHRILLWNNSTYCWLLTMLNLASVSDLHKVTIFQEEKEILTLQNNPEISHFFYFSPI